MYLLWLAILLMWLRLGDETFLERNKKEENEKRDVFKSKGEVSTCWNDVSFFKKKNVVKAYLIQFPFKSDCDT